MALKRRPAVEPGSYVQAYCTRCKTVLRHTVVALVEGVPVRVQCNTCGGEHVYRAAETTGSRESPRVREPKGERAPRAPGRKALSNLEAEWREQLAAAGSRPARRYAVAESFGKGELVEHASFGVGVVQRVLEPGKILVLFASGTKTLVCKAP